MGSDRTNSQQHDEMMNTSSSARGRQSPKVAAVEQPGLRGLDAQCLVVRLLKFR